MFNINIEEVDFEGFFKRVFYRSLSPQSCATALVSLSFFIFVHRFSGGASSVVLRLLATILDCGIFYLLSASIRHAACYLGSCPRKDDGWAYLLAGFCHLFVTYTFKGATIGKQVFGLSIVRSNNLPYSFLFSCFRLWLKWIGISFVGMFLMIAFVANMTWLESPILVWIIWMFGLMSLKVDMPWDLLLGTRVKNNVAKQ